MRCTTPLLVMYDRRMKSLILRNRVAMVSTKTHKAASCMKEMTSLFDCLAQNEFQDQYCAAQNAAFLNCGRERIHLRQTGQLNQSEGRMTSAEINEMLRIRYRQL
eukprot:scpid103566/ scgid12939/ 